jgi:hypothetical protein
MSHIFWELKEIPIPPGAHINQSDGRVYVFLDIDKNTRESRRLVICKATSLSTMHPNENFRYRYPGLWEQHYGERDRKPHILHAGLYASSLAIGCDTGLYRILNDIYGPLHANALMDYSMFSIRERSDSSMNYESSMSERVVFSKDRLGDTWLSEFFTKKLNASDCEAFKAAWIEECRGRGVTKAWINIDGSNNNCSAERCSLAEKGKAKSGLNVNIVSYICAVSATDGSPITFDVNPGGMVDSKAVMKIIALLSSHGIETEGVVMDRGFCTHSVVEALGLGGIDYVVMLHSDDHGHVAMLGKHGDGIRWKVPFAVNGRGLFGISGRERLFSSHPEEAYISLFFDGANGSDRAICLIGKILDAVRGLREDAKEGRRLSVPKGVERYISIKDGEICVDYALWQQGVDNKGFCSIATSFPCDPSTADHIYHLRDASEKQYMVFKSQLGFGVTRVHSTEGGGEQAPRLLHRGNNPVRAHEGVLRPWPLHIPDDKGA